MAVWTKKFIERCGARAGGLALVLVVALVAALVPLSAPQAQATKYTEGPDYQFFYETFSPPLGTLRQDWNLYGGAEQLPYYIHADLIADGFETAVRNAFSTMENDPGSQISFVYMGSTTVRSELVGTDVSCCSISRDGVNVVSYGRLPSWADARGGFGGPFDITSAGQPTGQGTGHFDITLSNTTNFSDGPRADAVDVESVVLHELGHALGLDHPTTNQATLMWDTLQNGTTKRGLHPADQLALSILYGCEEGETGCEVEATCNGAPITHDMNALGVSVFTGTAGDDVILGTSGADTIDAGPGDDTVCAGDGDDVVVGGEGDDAMFGEAGRDIIRGNAGIDVIDGGDGNDRLLGGIDGDTLIGGEGDDYLGGFGGADTIVGGPGNETIFGGFGADTIDGGAGNDVISGLIGNDTINGGDGNDTLNGDRGGDTINGGSGNDTINGGNGDDILSGDGGDDTVNGGRADDQLSGGAGTNDTCVGNKQNVADFADGTCETIFGVP